MATTPSNTPIIPPPADYTAADRDTILITLQEAVQQVYPGWTDFNRAAPGNLYLHSIAHVGDVLTKYQNDQAGECFWGMVRRRKNAIGLARGDGIRLKGQAAATVDLTFTLSAISANKVTIPRGTKVTTIGLDDAIDFFTVADLVIAAGDTVGTVSARNATPATDAFNSIGAPSQVFRLSQAPMVEDSDVVIVGSQSYERVPNFFNSGPTSPHYVVLVDENERGFLVFGNGVSGRVPPQSDPIDVSYEIGGGRSGNVPVGSVRLLSTSITDAGGNVVSITVTNAAAAGGGADRESVERARRRIPGTLRALTRCVAKEDYEIVALGVPGVARSLMLTTDEDITVPDNEGYLIVIPEGDPATTPSAALKAQVKGRVTVDFPNTLTFRVTMTDPTFLDVAVTCQVKKKPNFTDAQVTAAIKAVLASFFALETADDAPNPNVDFGGNLTDNLLAWSDIFKAVAGAAGVLRVEEDTFVPADDVTLGKTQFPRLGTVTVTFL